MSECIQMFPTYTLSTNKSNRQVILFLEVNIKTSFLCPKSVGRIVWIPFYRSLKTKKAF